MVLQSFQSALRKCDIMPSAHVDFILPLNSAGVKWWIKQVRFQSPCNSKFSKFEKEMCDSTRSLLMGYRGKSRKKVMSPGGNLYVGGNISQASSVANYRNTAPVGLCKRRLSLTHAIGSPGLSGVLSVSHYSSSSPPTLCFPLTRWLDGHQQPHAQLPPT